MHFLDDSMIVSVRSVCSPASQTHFGGITWQLSCFNEPDHFLKLSALVIDFIFAQRDEYLAGPLDAQPEAKPLKATRRWHDAAFLWVQL